MKLTLLRKGVLLVSIPLVFEVSIFGVLINMQDSLVREAQRIDHNKKINDVVNLIGRDCLLINNALQLNAGVDSAWMTQFHNQDVRERVLDIQRNFLMLEDMAHDDPAMMSKISDAEFAMKLLLEDIKALRSGIRKEKSVADAARFLSHSRGGIEQHLSMLLRSGVFDLAEQSLKGTVDVRSHQIEGQKKALLIGALLFSAFLAISLAYLTSRNIAGRLKLLSKNAERLGKGEPLLAPVSGDDEIASLDRNLHTAAELIQAAKKMRQEVTAMITHDLKSPLQSVGGFLEMLDASRLGTLNEVGAKLLITARNAVKQMAGLIDSVLQLEKLRSGVVRLQTASLELPPLLDKCLDAVKLMAEQRQVTFVRNYSGTGCDTICGDAFWLEQVFVNILSNAVKFTEKGTEVVVTTSSGPAGTVDIHISDKGPGIAPHELKLIFDRFHSTQASVAAGGTGLGLPIAKELIELHRGAISVESEVGKGSEFIMRLPFAALDSASSPAAISTAASRNGERSDNEPSGDKNRLEGSSADLEAKIETPPTSRSAESDEHHREFVFSRKKFRLRVLHKGLILISIPLIFEVFIFAQLMVLQNELERETQRISEFKRFNDDANIVMRDMAALALTERHQKINVWSKSPQVQGWIKELDAALVDAKQVADTPSTLQSVQDYEQGLHQFLAEVYKRSRQIEDGTYKKSYQKSKQQEEFYHGLQTTLTATVVRLGNRSFNPRYELRGEELRQRPRQVLNYALAFSILFAMTAAFMYRNDLVGRLNRVSDNANRLAKGEPLLEPVGGSDEIAELDATVHYAADLISAATKMRQEATAMITHDLKTPLQSVRNYFEMLGCGKLGELNEKGARLLQFGQRSLQHMADLINSVLQLEKLRTGNVNLATAKLQLAALLDACLDSIKLLAGQKNIAILRGYDQSETAQINGDEFWLGQVFANVLSNAIKFSPENSTILVGLKKRERDVEVQIQDQGPGIPESDLGKIFERYHRVKSTAAVPGTGLGLPIAKELIDLHHGSISVESKLGSGCTFSIVLPLAQEASNGAPA